MLGGADGVELLLLQEQAHRRPVQHVLGELCGGGKELDPLEDEVSHHHQVSVSPRRALSESQTVYVCMYVLFLCCRDMRWARTAVAVQCKIVRSRGITQ